MGLTGRGDFDDGESPVVIIGLVLKPELRKLFGLELFPPL